MNRGNGKYVRRAIISVSYEIYDAKKVFNRLYTLKERCIVTMLDIGVIKISSFASGVSWSK